MSLRRLNRTVEKCEYLINGRCTILDKQCNYKKPADCGFRFYYTRLNSSEGSPIAVEVKKRMASIVLKNWKEFDERGNRNMVARPLEDTVSDVFRQKLSAYGVNVVTRKKFNVGQGYAPIIDIRLEKPSLVTSLISIKSYLSPGAFRDSFGNAYFAKLMYGQRNIKFFIVTIAVQMSADMVELARPYIDGVYRLSESPYIDELVNLAEGLYSTR